MERGGREAGEGGVDEVEDTEKEEGGRGRRK